MQPFGTKSSVGSKQGHGLSLTEREAEFSSSLSSILYFTKVTPGLVMVFTAGFKPCRSFNLLPLQLPRCFNKQALDWEVRGWAKWLAPPSSAWMCPGGAWIISHQSGTGYALTPDTWEGIAGGWKFTFSRGGSNPLSYTITPWGSSAGCHQVFLQAMALGHLPKCQENCLTIPSWISASPTLGPVGK